MIQHVWDMADKRTKSKPAISDSCGQLTLACCGRPGQTLHYFAYIGRSCTCIRVLCRCKLPLPAKVRTQLGNNQQGSTPLTRPAHRCVTIGEGRACLCAKSRALDSLQKKKYITNSAMDAFPLCTNVWLLCRYGCHMSASFDFDQCIWLSQGTN